ncbi:MAG: 2-amino-4-hydroxy-6-hydroxymethyldihydropteridine diphosphokinase [Actinomycetota bacterium]|jgi:2-amino-4-hydroxy-6-hydroxymethyldihydropteridine diphosphokinase|nr:2-amino-4-hydroxy-6-hydroxymethyldihydropteridine diphosphokinase [Actinomycetota bacterium]
MIESFVGIGSNVGDRAQFVRSAVEVLNSTEGVEITATSSLYETSPIGGPPQRSYVNMVVRIRTSLDHRVLLETCQAIEQKLGREESDIRWGPRVVDLDILTFDDTKISEPDLEIPHPRMTGRRFVLIPLLEIDPEASDPWGGRYQDILDEAEGDVELLEAF